MVARSANVANASGPNWCLGASVMSAISVEPTSVIVTSSSRVSNEFVAVYVFPSAQLIAPVVAELANTLVMVLAEESENSTRSVRTCC